MENIYKIANVKEIDNNNNNNNNNYSVLPTPSHTLSAVCVGAGGADLKKNGFYDYV